MNKLVVKLFALALISIAVSCVKPEPVNEDDPVVAFKPSFNQISGDPACALYWESGVDSLKQWYSKTTKQWSVIYPFSKLRGTDPTWVGVSIPALQIAEAGQPCLKEYGFWIANSDGLTEKLPLNPEFAVVKFQLDAAGTVLENRKFSSIKIIADTVVSGNGIIDVTTGAFVVKPAGKKFEISMKDSAAFSETLPVYGVIWPTSTKTMSLEIPCSDKYRLTVTLDDEYEFEKGKCTLLNLSVLQLVASGKAEIEVDRKDLGEKATANCYVVSEQGYYKFKATRGNSDVVPSKLSKVDWLWRDGSLGLLDDIELKNGYVTFWAGSGKGNTIIAAFDDAGNILWSWHIWQTDDPALKFGYGTTTSYKFLDRNLGATSSKVDSIASYGLYYQWGRKDPVIGSSTIGYGTATKRIEQPGFTTATAEYQVNPLYNTHSFKTVANTSLTDGKEVEYTIANPMTFITGTTWFCSNDNLTANKGLWGWSSGNVSSKTIYDPCPPGWKVPVNMGGVETGVTPFTITSEKGIYGTVYTGVGGTQLYFPPAGARDNTGAFVTYAGWVGRYWGALYREKSWDCWTLTIEGNPFNPKQSHIASSFGASVRCVNE